MTTTAPSMTDRLAAGYEWTPRQRQVLHLLQKGKTNGEIASALDISLDGAKWHVSEIMSRIQASSREEVAEYWRLYNGLAPRLGRVFRGLSFGGFAKWTGAVAGAGAVAGIAGVAVLAMDLGANGAGEAQSPAGTVQSDCQSPEPWPFGTVSCSLFESTEQRLQLADDATVRAAKISEAEAIAVVKQHNHSSFPVLEARLVHLSCASPANCGTGSVLRWAVSVGVPEESRAGPSGAAIYGSQLLKLRAPGDARPFTPEDEATASANAATVISAYMRSVDDFYHLDFIDPETGEWLSAAENLSVDEDKLRSLLPSELWP